MKTDGSFSHLGPVLYRSPAPQDDAFWERQIAFAMGVVEAEDFQQQTVIQRNLRSGLLDETVFGRNGPALIYFHEQLGAALGPSGMGQGKNLPLT